MRLRKNVINTASKLYDKLLNIHTTQYDNFSEDQKKNVNVLNKPENLIINFVEDDLQSMPPLEGDEEVKLEPEETITERVKSNPRKRKLTGTGLKILTPTKLLARLPILWAQIKAGNNPYKLKYETKKILHLLYQHNKITKKVYKNFNQVIVIMKENVIVIKEYKTFYFDFDWSIGADENMKHEIEFIIKDNENSVENKIKNYIEQVLLKNMHGNDIH